MASLRFLPLMKKVAHRPRTRLYLEFLEGRCLPSTVTNLTDHDPGSLRDAIATTPAGGAVNFQPGLTGTITLTSATLIIANDVTMVGPGADKITVSGNKTFQVFTIAPAVTVTISGLTIANGTSALFGGGICNDGTLTISNCAISGNSSGNRGGGIYNSCSATLLVTKSGVSGNSTPNAGGGVYNVGTLTVSNSSFSANGSMGADGGAIYNVGTATVSKSTFSGNGGSQAYGGAIRNDAEMTVDPGTYSQSQISGFSQNVGTLGGDIYNVGTLTINSRLQIDLYNIGTLRPGHSGGSLINYGTVTISNESFSGNATSDAAIWNAPSGNLTLINCTVSHNFDGGGIRNLGRLMVDNCIFSGNYNVNDGGAISGGTVIVGGSVFSGNGAEQTGAISAGSLTISNSTFSGNDSQFGVSVISAGQLAMINCVISGNRTRGWAAVATSGGISAISNSTISGNNNSGFGNTIVTVGTVTITNSTISGNTNSESGAIGNSGTLTISNCTISGNTGLRVGGIGNRGSLIVSNSTISRNAGYTSGRRTAGGIANIAQSSDATILVLNCTIANNTVAGNDRTGSQLYSGPDPFRPGTGRATIQLRNTIVSGGGSRPNVFADVGGTFVSQGHNLSSDDGSGFLTGPGDLINANPFLGPLQDNGGPTFTMALLPGSPAIDAGDNAGAPDFDQRGPGFPRIVGGVIDIGAFEVQLGAATHFQIDAPAQVTSKIPFDVTLTALDAYGHTAAGYLGMVSFSSSDPDPGVMLPPDYTFTAQDGGVHAFPAGVILVTPGDQTLTVTDTNGITGSAMILVTAPAPPPCGGEGQSKKIPGAGRTPDAFFLETRPTTFANTAETFAGGATAGGEQLPWGDSLDLRVTSHGAGFWSERASWRCPIFLGVEEAIDLLLAG